MRILDQMHNSVVDRINIRAKLLLTNGESFRALK